MSSYKARVAVQLKAYEILGAGTPSGRKGPVDLDIAELLDFANETLDSGSNVVRCYLDTQSAVGASTTTTYDLVGSLTDLEGTTLNFDLVYYVIVYNRSATYAITLGPNATQGFGIGASNQGFWADASDRSYIPPASMLILHSSVGVPAVAATSDELDINTLAGSSANAFSTLIIGRDNA